MIDVITTIKGNQDDWTVSVRNAANPVQQWRKRYGDGLEAHREAFDLKLINRRTELSASPLGISHRYHSEGAKSVDPDAILAKGFSPRDVEFRYRTLVGNANVAGSILRSFDTLPACGEIVNFDQPGLRGDFQVKSVSGPFDHGGTIQFWVELEATTK